MDTTASQKTVGESRQGFYVVVCAWCGKHLRWMERQGNAPDAPAGQTSHGICADCAAHVLQQPGVR
jgi:hypothetical protein